MMADQLVGLMGERGINFSIFSPRKISFLFKLYEKSGGDLQQALCKNYAKDRRHLILLNGFQLQERPISPQPVLQQQQIKQENSEIISKQSPTPSPHGQKRSLSPANTINVPNAPNLVSVTQPPQQHSQIGPLQQIAPGQQQLRGPPPHSPFTQPAKVPTPDAVRPNRGASPVQRMSWNPGQTPGVTPPPPTISSVASPAGNNMTVLQSQLAQGPQSLGPRSVTPTQSQQMPGQQNNAIIQQTQQQNSTLAGLVSQQPRVGQQQMRPVGMVGIHQQGIRGNATFNPPSSSPTAQQQQNALSGQLIRGSVASPLNTQIQMQASPLSVHDPTLQQNQSQPSQAPQKTRKRIWSGIIEYQEKPVQPPGQGQQPNPSNRITYTLNCQISSNVISPSGEAEVNAEKWPEKLVLQLLPRPLIMKLFDILRQASHLVGLHFNQESEGLQKLSKIMSTNWVGCIQFTSPTTIRMMIVLYMVDKKLYMGFIPNDQEDFFSKMRQMIEQHKKEQIAKQQKMVIYKTFVFRHVT